MNILTPEQKRTNDVRSKAGAILKSAGMTGAARRAWLDARAELSAEDLRAAALIEYLLKEGGKRVANG